MNSDDAHGTYPISEIEPASKATARYLNVISTKRSGHHAFISWVQAGSRQRTQFFNNCAIKKRTLNRVPSLSREQTEPTTLIFNYEGVTPRGVARALSRQQSTNSIIDKIIFVRDPLNVCASLMHRESNIHAKLFRIMRQMFALKSLLELHRQEPCFADLIFYNRWLTDGCYRDNVAQQLSLSRSMVISEISKFGGGSSFQDLSHGGDAAAPKLLTRWKTYKDNSIFQAIVGNPHFVSTFQDVSSGVIRAANGETDFDEERADYLHRLSRQKTSRTYMDRLIDGFARDQRFFEKIDSRVPRFYKDAMILNVYLRAALPVAA